MFTHMSFIHYFCFLFAGGIFSTFPTSIGRYSNYVFSLTRM